MLALPPSCELEDDVPVDLIHGSGVTAEELLAGTANPMESTGGGTDGGGGWEGLEKV